MGAMQWLVMKWLEIACDGLKLISTCSQRWGNVEEEEFKGIVRITETACLRTQCRIESNNAQDVLLAASVMAIVFT